MAGSLKQIISNEEQQRFAELVDKADSEGLTKAEKEEFRQLRQNNIPGDAPEA